MTLSLRIAALGLALAALPAAAQTKIGYVDLQRALNEVDEGKAAKALLKKDFEEKQRQLDGKKADFEKLRAEFEKQSVVMSDQAKRDKAAELDKVTADCEALGAKVVKLAQRPSSEAACTAIVKAGVDRFGRIDVLVNNVGGSAAGGPVEMSETATKSRSTS